MTKLDVAFVWMDQCQKAIELLKEYLLKEPLLVYPDTDKPYTLYTDASKYAWAGVLTQRYVHEIEGKEKEIYHPVTYLSGLFRGSELNWATLIKEPYAIFMCVKKLDYYLAGAQTTLRSDHLPLKKFLKQKTGNSKVNNWALSLEEYEITFEYIKGIKNTLADAMSRLVHIDPTSRLNPEPEGFEFGELKVNEDELDEVEVQSKDEHHSEQKIGRKEFVITVKEDDKEPIPEIHLAWNMSDKDIAKIQRRDEFCRKTIEEIQRRKRKTSDKYHMHNGLLHRYNLDYKQRFQALVIPVNYAKVVSKLAHDELGHNGTARTYALIKRMFYWKGLKKDMENYVKSCHICQQYNIQSVRYTSGHFEIPEAPMDFISMNLIGEFKIGSTQGNRYALTVICMLMGYTWCIPIADKSAEVIVKSYIKEVYSKYGGSRKILFDNGTEFKNKLFEQVARDLGIEHEVYSPPYHPALNGRREGFHSFLKACLAKHISNSLEWDDIVHLACSVYDFLPNEHLREAPFFLMFGRDPRIPVNDLLRPHIRYLGTDESILSLQAMRNIYKVVVHNLKMARKCLEKEATKFPSKVKMEDLIMLKRHDKKTFEPVYEGYYWVLQIRGNQVDVQSITGDQIKTVHIKDVKVVLPMGRVINEMPDYTKFCRKSKLDLDPMKIPDLNWVFQLNYTHKLLLLLQSVCHHQQ